MKKNFLLAALLVVAVVPANAALIQFDLTGKAGTGLLGGNESPAVSGGGSGGKVGAGIFLDTVTGGLTLNAGWGTANGFANLTGSATGFHIHGPTASNNGNGFTENAAVLFDLIGLAGVNPTANAGGIFSQTITLTAAQQTNLLNGKCYINAHTAANGGGEIRGFLVWPGIYPALTIITNGNGSIIPGSGNYVIGSNVVLTATPGFGYTFTGWSGAASGTNNPITVTMTTNKTVTGNFTFATNGISASIALAAQISWFAVTNVHYQVQAASVLNSNVWLDLGGQIAGNNATNFYYEPFGTNQNRFFRVLTRP
jgi:uncharacterized repeat protein (TIGR02543 family)